MSLKCQTLMWSENDRSRENCFHLRDRLAHPRNRDVFQGKILPRNLAVDLGTAPDLGQDLLGNFESVQQQRVPMEGLDVHEECSRSVGDVGDVKTTVGTARQVLQTGK